MALFTLITNAETGEVIGGAHGHVSYPPRKAGLAAGLIAGPGQTVEHIEIPDRLAEITDPAEFGAQLRAHLGK